MSPISLEYDLYIEPDTNTDGHMHWYHFRTISKALEPGAKIRFNIRNLLNSKSLHAQGMSPRICFNSGLIGCEKREKGWHTDPDITSNVRYYATDKNEEFDFEVSVSTEVKYYTLSFVYEV